MSMIELIYDADCPNIELARMQIRQVLADAGLPVQWREWERSMPDVPDYVRRYGSPTILVNGSDVAGLNSDADASCCRVYIGMNGRIAGVPPVDSILAALRRQPPVKLPEANALSAYVRRLGPLAAIPAIGSSMLPMLGCPACWPVYAGVLGVLGISVADYTAYMLPMTLFFLVIALISPAHNAWNGRQYGGLLLGIVASILIVVGKFVLKSDVVSYMGILLLIGVSIYTFRARQRNVCSDGPCRVPKHSSSSSG